MKNRIAKTLALTIPIFSLILAQAKESVQKYEWKRMSVERFDDRNNIYINARYAKLKNIPDDETITKIDPYIKLKALCDVEDKEACWYIEDYPQVYESDELCNNLVKELNSYKYSNDIEKAKSCGKAIARSYQGFKDPEDWHELDPMTMRNLLFEVALYSNGWADDADHKKNSFVNKAFIVTDNVNRFMNGTDYSEKGRLFFWKIAPPKKFLTINGNWKEGVKGEPWIYLLTYSSPVKNERYEQCSYPAEIAPFNINRTVNKELTGPDSRLKDETYPRPFNTMDRSSLKFYRNNLYNVDARYKIDRQGADITIGSFDLRTAAEIDGTFCRIGYLPVVTKRGK